MMAATGNSAGFRIFDIFWFSVCLIGFVRCLQNKGVMRNHHGTVRNGGERWRNQQ